MTFLFPVAAWLALLGLPVVIFYLLKTRQRRRAVSTFLFWDQIRPRMENSPLWRKLRRWLSLLLQLLVLAFLIAALARPAFDWERDAPRRTVFVLDPSASMGATRPGPDRWQNAIDRGKSTIDRLRLQDEASIILATNPPRILSGWTGSKRTLRAAFESAIRLPTGTDPREALFLAGELARLRQDARIEVLSDAVWPGTASTLPTDPVQVRGVDPEPPINAGLSLFAVRRSPLTPGDWQLEAEVTSAQPSSGTLELFQDGRAIDRVRVEATPEVAWKKHWRGTSDAGAAFEAVLQPGSGDLLSADNSARCELPPLTALRVLVVGPPAPFLEAVLESIPLVIWQRLDRLPEPVPEGTRLLIFTVNPPEALPADVPALFIDPENAGFWGTPSDVLAETPVTEIDRRHPLVRHAGFVQVAIDQARRWNPSAGADVLVGSLGNPLIFGRWDVGRRWLVLGFDPEKSDLPLRTAFPVFTANLLESLREESTSSSTAALLPGRVETGLKPLLAPSAERVEASGLPVFPGWWWVLLAGFVVVFAEWFLFHRRITD